MKHTMMIAALLLSACGPTEHVEQLDPDAVSCCACLAEATDPLGQECMDLEIEECALDIKDGLTPGGDRCYTGGKPYCSSVCGDIFWRASE